ncbi:uncharacterized protein LOC111700552 isoform X1 [Eurytemora carolleeae]|uniref:uncharacterized protein LOC111700552 isoform X1 n=1 Tax=Eurytemora carolleeae TaxID=1294199 RepID=UPI000C75EE72|nr:uncharacterized protein LOC111700552 isoform X1 [Eurytemora carolleeae]|eukprot:XP_023327282.1 uncharacterized protein LOC111700552 isoform X1 [Eurytemora affinis]
MIFFRGFFTNMNNNKKWCLKLFFQLWICEAVCRIQTLSDQYSKKDILATQLNQILERKLANDRDKGLRMYPSFTFPFSTRDWENNSKGEMFNSLRSGRCLYDDKRLCDPQTSLFSIGKFIEDCNRVTREQKCSTITQNVTVGTLIEVCKIPLVNSCSINQTIAYGLKGCRIEYEDVCKTILKDTEVEEDIVKCKNEEKKQCNDAGLSCIFVPFQVCNVDKQKVKRKISVIRCSKESALLCAPQECKFEPGKEECKLINKPEIQEVKRRVCWTLPRPECRFLQNFNKQPIS